MRKAYFLFLLLITLTGCSDTMAYSPGGEPPLARCFLCTSCKRKQDIFNKKDSIIMPQPETLTSTEITPETVPKSFLAATESQATTQTCAASAEPAESIIITEAKKAETTQETAVYTETTAMQETTVQITSPTVVTTISTTTTTPESTTQTTTELPQIVDMNALSPQMWAFLTEAESPRWHLLPLHFVQAATGFLQINFMLNYDGIVPTFAAGIGRQIVSGDSPPYGGNLMLPQENMRTIPPALSRRLTYTKTGYN